MRPVYLSGHNQAGLICDQTVAEQIDERSSMAEEEPEHRGLLATHYVPRDCAHVFRTRIPDVTGVASCFGNPVEPAGRRTLHDACAYRDQRDPSSDEEQ